MRFLKRLIRHYNAKFLDNNGVLGKKGYRNYGYFGHFEKKRYFIIKSFKNELSYENREGMGRHWRMWKSKFVNNIQILGVYFSTFKPVRLIKDNWEDKINKLENILALWSKTKETLIVKVTMLKAFGMSQCFNIM